VYFHCFLSNYKSFFPYKLIKTKSQFVIKFLYKFGVFLGQYWGCMFSEFFVHTLKKQQLRCSASLFIWLTFNCWVCIPLTILLIVASGNIWFNSYHAGGYTESSPATINHHRPSPRSADTSDSLIIDLHCLLFSQNIQMTLGILNIRETGIFSSSVTKWQGELLWSLFVRRPSVCSPSVRKLLL
jgi:hypothetical protein